MSDDTSLPTGELVFGFDRKHRVQLCKNINCTYLVSVEVNKIDTDLGYSLCSSCGHTANWDMTRLQRLRVADLLVRMNK